MISFNEYNARHSNPKTYYLEYLFKKFYTSKMRKNKENKAHIK